MTTPPTQARGGSLTGCVLLALLYFGAAKAGLMLATLHGNVSPVWPASGLAVAAMIGRGRRCWPGVLAGAFAANALTSAPLWVAALIAAGNTAEALLGAWIHRRVQAGAIPLGKFTDAVGFIVLAPVAASVSAVVGVAALLLSGQAPADQTQALLQTWWSGDAIGMLVFAPALLALPALRHMRPDRGDWARGAGFGALLLMAGGLIWTGGFSGARIFLFFPMLLLAAAWFGGTGAKLGAAGMALFTVAFTASQSQLELTFGLNQSLLVLQLYLVALGATGLLLAVFKESGLLLLPGIVVVVGWAGSGVVFVQLDHQRSRLDEFRIQSLIDDTQGAIGHRLETYVDALRGGASLFAASDLVTRRDWEVYAASLDIVNRHPGINGIGWVAPLRADEVADFLARTRADGAPDFSLRFVPGAPRPPDDPAGYAHYVITYIVPLAKNLPAQGLDLASERHRAEAARLARDAGRPTITERITLVQDGRKGPGFLLYYPMYMGPPGPPPPTEAERRASFLGWVYAPFITEDFLRAVLPRRERQLDVQVYSGTETTPEALIFDSAAETRDGPPAPPERVTRLDLLNQGFTLTWSRGKEFRPGSQLSAVLAGASLALVSTLLAGLVLVLQTLGRRASEIADARTLELRELNERLEKEVAERSRAEREALHARASAESANEAKSAFLATMSHEIRTPMNSVIGYTDLLLDSPVNPEQRAWLGYIQSSGRALLGLINNILDISKIEAGRLTLESIPFSPEQVLRDVATLLDRTACGRDVKLDLTLRAAPPGAVNGDPSRFRQVVINLVSNAIKFTEHGAVRVEMNWTPAEPGRGTLSVAVRDNGIGIAPDKLASLFTKFTQADSSTTRRFGGTGLGLAICKELIGLMGGRIWVESEEGRGACFRFEVPCTLAPVPTPENNPAAVASTSPLRYDGLRVLLADDTLLNQRLGSTVLQRLGCEVDVATNGREAVTLFQKGAYDLIYMDCLMPELDGFDATREIRKVETTAGDGRHTPIVAMTANALAGDREKCLASGMDDYVTKPFTIADIKRTLARWTRTTVGSAS